MSKRIRVRLLFVLFVSALSVFLLMKQGIRLGLDLRGGTLLILQVVTDDAIRAETDRAIERLRQELQQESIAVRQISRVQNDRFQVTGVDPAKEGNLRRIFSERFSDWDLSSTYDLRMRLQVEQTLREQSVDQAMQTIRNRLDKLGVSEMTIQRHGSQRDYEILIQIPGSAEATRIKSIIQATAILELKLVDSGPHTSEQAAKQDYGGSLPAALEMLPSSESGHGYYVVQRVASISGRDLKNAYASRDENGRPAVTFNLSTDGAKRFGYVTETNVGKRLAIVLDGRIQSAPQIYTRITDAGTIQGGSVGFSPQQAQDLALVLRSGALPASIRYLQENLVGASLGADSIRQGITASVVALSSVVVVMVSYYRLWGVNATVAMLLNLVILFGAMAYFGATLTLPGIAGVILTIGVGIDSNVLIFERIREELRAGKPLVTAVAISFKRVFVTLLDTHLAALISAAFLFLFGTGPVRGFAVTLVIGLISNLFTAVFVSRTLFEYALTRKL